MVLGAPLIVGSLYTIGSLGFKNKLEVILKTDMSGSSLDNKSSMSWFLLLKNKFTRCKAAGGFKSFIKYLIIFFIIKFIVFVLGYGSPSVTQFFNSTWIIWFLKFGCIVSMFLLMYLILKVYLFKKFYKNQNSIDNASSPKEAMPEIYPSLIKNILGNIPDNIDDTIYQKLLKFYYMNIFIYFSILVTDFLLLINFY